MEERGFFEVMKEAITAIAPGLQNFVPEVGAELSRLGTQGAAEFARPCSAVATLTLPTVMGKRP